VKIFWSTYWDKFYVFKNKNCYGTDNAQLQTQDEARIYAFSDIHVDYLDTEIDKASNFRIYRKMKYLTFDFDLWSRLQNFVFLIYFYMFII